MKFDVADNMLWYKVSLLVASILLLAACTLEIPPPSSTGGPLADSADSEGQVSLAQLRNATYSGIYDEPISLMEGLYEGAPFVEGGAARPRVEFIDELVPFGDLTGDGVADAAVILVESSGGSGVFSYLAVQINKVGQPVDGGAHLLGDRIQIVSAAIVDGEVVIEIVTQGPDDPQCCATLKMRQTFALQDGQLAMTGSEELGIVTLDDLRATSWVLHSLDFDQPVEEGLPRVTLLFDGEGISGSAGCNSYRAGVSSASAQLLQVEPVITTRMGCAAEILAQETTYVEALQRANQWGYVAGQLAILYETEDGSLGALRFEPATGPQAGGADGNQTSASIDALFLCPDGTQIPVTFDNARDVAVVTLPDGVVELPHAISGSGARYSNATVLLWNKGDEVLIEIDGETVYSGCIAQGD